MYQWWRISLSLFHSNIVYISVAAPPTRWCLLRREYATIYYSPVDDEQLAFFHIAKRSQFYLQIPTKNKTQVKNIN